jgi:phenylpropionate dioxygenase-like ring-hydroxylating dioxygenase large terminal subunit
VYPHCAHRGTSLYYGKVEERGIRCCYHGWLFDVQGHCVEQPCEPGTGGARRDKVRQPWYPVQEQYGLVWAYMGPPDKKPVLPRYECLETLEPGEFLEADDRSIGGGGPQVIPCNWLQHYENLVDPFHVVILHSSFSGTQFVPRDGHDAAGDLGHHDIRRAHAVTAQAGRRHARCAASARPACPRCA